MTYFLPCAGVCSRVPSLLARVTHGCVSIDGYTRLRAGDHTYLLETSLWQKGIQSLSLRRSQRPGWRLVDHKPTHPTIFIGMLCVRGLSKQHSRQLFDELADFRHAVILFANVLAHKPQVLDLRDTELTKLPREIGRLPTILEVLTSAASHIEIELKGQRFTHACSLLILVVSASSLNSRTVIDPWQSVQAVCNARASSRSFHQDRGCTTRILTPGSEVTTFRMCCSAFQGSFPLR